MKAVIKTKMQSTQVEIVAIGSRPPPQARKAGSDGKAKHANHGGEGVNAMEIKAEQDIQNTQMERVQVNKAFERWVEFHNQSSDKEPTVFEAFRAGWIEKPSPSAKGGE